jgi:hypothetical protein
LWVLRILELLVVRKDLTIESAALVVCGLP